MDNLTQQEIANRLNISRTRVSRYLEEARKKKIVEIKINAKGEDFSDLEYEIEKKFRIKECIVVSSSEDREKVLAEMAEELASLFERILKDGDYFGIGWGTSLKSIVDYLSLDRKLDIKVVPLIGGLGKVGTGIHTNSIAKIIADKFGGISYMIHSPAVLDSKEAKEIIQNDSNTREIFDMADKINVAMVGMSDIGPESTLVKAGNFSMKDFEYLGSLGVVGDVNLIFIDKEGKHIPNRIDERIITLPLEKIKRIENVIGIGFGSRKLKVILASLKGKIVDILVTDEATAREIAGGV